MLSTIGSVASQGGLRYLLNMSQNINLFSMVGYSIEGLVYSVTANGIEITISSYDDGSYWVQGGVTISSLINLSTPRVNTIYFEIERNSSSGYAVDYLNLGVSPNNGEMLGKLTYENPATQVYSLPVSSFSDNNYIMLQLFAQAYAHWTKFIIKKIWMV